MYHTAMVRPYIRKIRKYSIYKVDYYCQFPLISGSLSPRHGASSGCGWRNDLHTWIAANILSSRGQSTRGGPPAWGFGDALTTPHRKTFIMSRHVQRSLGIRLILRYDLSNGNDMKMDLREIGWGSWAGSTWLRIGARGGLLWMLGRTFGFRKMQRISWMA
jgi:hypothetical protein